MSCLFWFSPHPARAGDTGEMKDRIDFIQQRLDRGTQTAKLWQYSWMTVHTAGTLLSATSAIE
ncbi:MAG: hypothetical protein JEZ12_21425 [Desulfobacterium sp.]|nr:hypothetical protein [Desulfobacterium sp.]